MRFGRRCGEGLMSTTEQLFRTIIPRLNLLLRKLDRRNRPAPGMAADGYSQAVVLVERDSFRRPRPSVAEDRGLGDKFGFGLLLANDRFAPEAAVRQSDVMERQRTTRPATQGSRLFVRTASHCDCRYRPRDRHRAPATSLSTCEADQGGTSPQQPRGRRRAS